MAWAFCYDCDGATCNGVEAPNLGDAIIGYQICPHGEEIELDEVVRRIIIEEFEEYMAEVRERLNAK
ncbi:MAG: hypothetical protein HN684_00895 [Euryarchaeota archaeon]|jgi:hypothetical protein|nr:hypothetical protein [Euryarchaeota archaeon]